MPFSEYFTALYFYFTKMHRKQKHSLTINSSETKMEVIRHPCHKWGGLWPQSKDQWVKCSTELEGTQLVVAGNVAGCVRRGKEILWPPV